MSLVNEAVAEWRKSLDVVAEVISSIAETLGIEDRAAQFDSDTQLLDNLAELDSMAIVELVLALEHGSVSRSTIRRSRARCSSRWDHSPDSSHRNSAVGDLP